MWCSASVTQFTSTNFDWWQDLVKSTIKAPGVFKTFEHQYLISSSKRSLHIHGMQTWEFHLRQLSSVVTINYENKDRMNYWLHTYWSRIKSCVGHVLEVEMNDWGRGKVNVWVWSLFQVDRLVSLVHCCLTALAKKPRSVNTGVRFLPVAWWIPGKFHCWAPDTKNIPGFDKFEGAWWWCVRMVSVHTQEKSDICKL